MKEEEKPPSKTTSKTNGQKIQFCYGSMPQIDEFDLVKRVYKTKLEYEYWFKLIPWEDIAIEEAELARLLTHTLQNQKAIILNPAYTLMFQSKAFMKV